MFEFVVALFIGWLTITLLGHASWIVVAKFFYFVSGNAESDISPPLERKVMAKSVIRELCAKGRIDKDTMNQLFSAIDDQARHTSLSPKIPQSSTDIADKVQCTTEPASPTPHNTDLENQETASAKPEILVATLLADDIPTAPKQPVTESTAFKPHQLRPESPQPVDTSERQEGNAGEHETGPRPSTQQTPNVSVVAAAAVSPESRPTLSKSEIIQSFLSAHNIRWGELIAGMLIVVCSIGLVISLWGPLVQTHRAIPTLIFLAANAAIYSVGLYTLARWRLRHTSRAVLVIATLLIPLSVLAGIAASGIDATQAIDLSDPITLVTIGLAGIIYSVFLYLGGKALTNRWHAWSIFTSVAGSIIALVFAPAVIRTFESQAGWLMAVASSAVVLSCVMIGKWNRHATATIGPAGARIRLLVLGLSAYSMAIATLSLGYHLRGFERHSWLPLAMAAIPACIALAGVALSLKERARKSTISMIGAVCGTLLFAITLIMFAPAMASPTWLWTWALLLSSCLIAGRHLFHQPSWYAISTLPIGLVATCTAQNWLGGQPWQTETLWTKFINGEAMMASLVMCVIGDSLCRVFAIQNPARKWLGYASIGWFSATLLITSLLSFMPETRMGIIPSWVVSATLFMAAFASLIFALRHYQVCYLTAITTGLAFNSIYKLSPSLALENLQAAIYLTLSVAGLLTLFSEACYRLAKYAVNDCSETAAATRQTLANISLAPLGAASALAIACANTHFELSCTTLAISVLNLTWLALLLSKLNIFKIAQLTSLVLTLSLTYHYLEADLCTKAGWLSGNAMWGWTAILGTLAVIWYLIRETLTFCGKRMTGSGTSSNHQAAESAPISVWDRLMLLFGKPTPPLTMPDSWFGLTAAGITAVATTYMYAGLNRSTVSQLPFEYNSSWIIPTLGWLAVTGFVVLLTHQKQQKEFTSTLAGLTLILAILWISCQVTMSTLAEAKTMLILTVSLATSLVLGTNTILRYLKPALLTAHFVNGCHATQGLVLVTGSISLLYSGVISHAKHGQLADLASAGSISLWWFIVSILALWQAKRTGQAWAIVLSAVFFAAAGTVLVTPFTLQAPLTQIQMACLLTFGWLAFANRVIGRTKKAGTSNHSVYLENILRLLVATGVITSVLTTAVLLFQLPVFHDQLGPAGFALSLITTVCLASKRMQNFFCGESFPKWTTSITLASCLFAAQLAWFAYQLNLTSGSLVSLHSVEIISAIWVLTATASLLLPEHRQQGSDFYHVAAVTFATLALASIHHNKSDVLTWLALIATVASGAQITLMAVGIKKLNIPRIAIHLAGWQVGLAGVVLPYLFYDFSPSYTILWITIWILTWRYLGRTSLETDGKPSRMKQLPLLDFSIVIFAASFADLTHSLGFIDNTHAIFDPLAWLRLTCYCLVSTSIVLRPRTTTEWFISLTSLCTAFSLLTIAITDMMDGSTSQKYTAAVMSSAFVLVVITSSLGNLAKLASWLTATTAATHFARLTTAATSMLIIFACVSVASPILMMIGQLPLIEVQIAIASIAMTAWACTEIAEQASRTKLRYAAVSLGLVAIAMWATASKLDSEHLVLTVSMRWLVASALITPILLFVLPKLIGKNMRERWTDPLQKGALTTASATLCSTMAMIILEFLLRDRNGIADLSLVAVIGCALTLGALSLLGGATALATGPKGYLRSMISISDQQRSQLILATQAFGFLTWLHIFLCKPMWAFAGLREHWPYLVMGLSFMSVGITEFARRRGDAVMAATIRKTSLYLPLIPMLGLWLSASNQGNGILTNMIDSHYEILLIIAAVYYLAVGTMWKAAVPRVAGVIFGNAAWWFVLVQLPGWDFLIHPQLWLIPPAACVLVMTHIYRERITPQATSAIRYGATLLIYISSSADMLLQQIGTTLSGPIILILLALAGMFLGVILQIRPFLYLGATFVFLGVTSMVWHANQAFDSTWPWWVFGISMGLILLAGLMMLEKFKPQLQAHAKKLSTWEA